MIYIFIDNDILIYLATGQLEDGDEILTHLETLLNKRTITLVVNDILLDEWNRNKNSKVIEAYEKSLRSRVKTLNELRPFLDINSSAKLNELINIFDSHKDVYLTIANERMRRIEALFEHKSAFKYPIIDEVKLKAMELALNNKRPYRPSKNSAADALHFLTCSVLLKGTKSTLYFVTNNKQDFSSSSNENELHEDLQSLLENVNLVYKRNIGETLNLISPRTISDEVVERISQAQQRITNSYVTAHMVDCHNCGKSLNDKDGIWRKGLYGLTYFLKCNVCGCLFDTGELFD